METCMKKQGILAVVGSRDYNDGADFDLLLSKFLATNPHITHLVSGGARGIDSLVEEFADLYMWPLAVIKPDYERHGKIAPLIRNCDIAQKCTEMLAFWDGQSRGTMHAVQQAVKKGKPVTIYSIARMNNDTITDQEIAP